jgi:hypothetical protein
LDGRRSRAASGTICALLFFVLPLFFSSCVYSTHNALPARYRTIAVPMFANKTYDDYTRHLEVEVTDSVRNIFIQTGELKIAGREDADLIMEGEILKFGREVTRSDRYGDPAELRLDIKVKISVYDVKEAKYIIKDHIASNVDLKSESGVYNLRRGESEDMGRQWAVTDMGRVIARCVLEHWPTK